MPQDAAILGLTLAGRFRVTGLIGEGGMATVYRSTQEAEPHDVAIKVMNPELAKDSRFVRRFRREAKAASMLKHPNTVSIIEFGVDQGYVFLAMECLEGFDLALLLHRERRITEVRAVSILIQVCKALGAAHELSIVHRDLKPDNIMLVKQPKGATPPVEGMGPADFVKVLDFGIAKILDEDEGKFDARAEPNTSAKSMLTRVGTIVGTPAYMAPEQGRAESVDGRTDVYACGVLLYELLTGRVPFSGETPMQVVMRHVNEPPDPPSKFIPVEPRLERVIMKALSKWPVERQQSAADLAKELTAVLPVCATEKRYADGTPSSAIAAGAVVASPLAAPPPNSGPMAPRGSGSSSSNIAVSRAVGASAVTAGAQAVAPSAPKPAQPVARAPAARVLTPSPDASTLVIEPKASTGPAIAAAPGVALANPAKPVTGGAPAFPTLNIDVPDDMIADIDAQIGAQAAGRAQAAAAPAPAVAARAAQPSPAAPVASAAVQARPVAAAPAAAPQVARNRTEPVPGPRPAAADDAAVDSDDEARTLITHDVPVTRATHAAPPAVDTDSDDDPRTVVAPPRELSGRGPSIPDLSQPLGALGFAGTPAPRVPDEKSTTLVSAPPRNEPGSSPIARGNTLQALKGTAKMDPIDIPLGVASPSPTTQPSPRSPTVGSVPDPARPVAPAVAAAVAAHRFEAARPLETAQTMSSASAAAAAAAMAAPAVAPRPTDSEVLPVPVLDDPGSPVLAGQMPTPLALWQPKRRRLTGPLAMAVGILIGALLFAIVFAALVLMRPE